MVTNCFAKNGQYWTCVGPLALRDFHDFGKKFHPIFMQIRSLGSVVNIYLLANSYQKRSLFNTTPL